MRIPRIAAPTRRDLRYGGLLVVLLVLPVTAGFAVADRGASLDAGDREVSITTAIDGVAGSTGPQEVSETPVGQVPGSMDDALTRLDDDLGALARVSYEYDGSGQVRIGDGDAVPLGSGLEAILTMTPFPPSDFDVDVAFDLLADGVPVTDATIDTTWDMVFMYHGPFLTEMANAGGGRYEASFDFFMFGPWELQTSVAVPGRDPIEFTVSIYVWPAG